jgi:hypothetical protein
MSMGVWKSFRPTLPDITFTNDRWRIFSEHPAEHGIIASGFRHRFLRTGLRTPNACVIAVASCLMITDFKTPSSSLK